MVEYVQFIVTEIIEEKGNYYLICKKEKQILSFCSYDFSYLEECDLVMLTKDKYEKYIEKDYFGKVLDYDNLDLKLKPFFSKGFFCFIKFLEQVFPLEYYPGLGLKYQEIYEFLISSSSSLELAKDEEDEIKLDIFSIMNNLTLIYLNQRYKNENIYNVFKAYALGKDYPKIVKNLTSKLLTSKNVEKMLIAWKDIYFCKNFLYLGIQKEDMILTAYKQNGSTDPLKDLYKSILKNPFVFLRNSRLGLAEEIYIKTHDDVAKISILKNLALLLNNLEKDNSYCLDLRENEILLNFINDNKELALDDYGLVIENNHLYTKYKYDIEKYIGLFLTSCLKTKLPRTDDILVYINNLMNVKIKANSCVILTGGPGTGKTTKLQEICNLLQKNRKTFVLSSFTGKAVCRIKEKVSFKNKVFTLDYIMAKKMSNDMEYLLIDEASMIHGEIFYKFLNSLKPFNLKNLKLILVGDENQLPPVGWGEIFCAFSSILSSDKMLEKVSILSSDKILEKDKPLSSSSYFKLEKVHRHSGELLDFVNNFREGIIEFNDSIKIYSGIDKEKLKDILKEIDKSNTKVLTIYNTDVKEINDMLKMSKKGYCIGDQVMLKENIYLSADDKSSDSLIIEDLSTSDKPNLIANGALGVITKIGKSIEVKFEETDYTFDEDEINMIDYGYCLTVHKMQGSESENIIFYIPSFKPFITKSIVYTAITRAKTNLTIIFKEKNYKNEMKKIIENEDCERINNFV